MENGEDLRRPMDYRVFAVNDSGRLAGVPAIITAANDDDARSQAERLAGRQAVELWLGARLVARIAAPAEPTRQALVTRRRSGTAG